MNDYMSQKCYLCGLKGSDTKDHIPPKNLFLQKYRNIGSDLITIPAHKKCNKKHELDDEYFRFFLLIPAYWESEYARELWENKIKNQIHRTKSRGFKKYILDNIIDVNVKTPSGIFLGKAEAEFINSKRVEGVIERIARGIYYKNTGYILPLDYHIEVEFKQPVVRKDRLKLEQKGKFISIGGGIFKYFWNYKLEDKKIGSFWLTFFDCVDFWVLTGKNK